MRLKFATKVTVVFSALNREPSSLRSTVAEQCCQQDLTGTPSSSLIPLSRYQCCTKRQIVSKLGKTNKKFPHQLTQGSGSTKEKAGSRTDATCREAVRPRQH